MAFQPQNYANIAPQGNSWVRDFIDNLTSGYKAGRLPYETSQLEQKQNLANKNQDLLNAFQGEKNNEQVPKFNSDMKTASLAQAMQAMLNSEQTPKFNSEMQTAGLGRQLDQARIAALNNKAALPFGGEVAPGSIGQAMWLDMISQKYGKDSPIYTNAAKAFDSDISSKQGLNEYRQSLTDNSDKRFSTTLGKEGLELADVQAGFMPGTGRTVPITPEQQKQMAGQYNLAQQKTTTDAATRAKTLYASNIDKTIGLIEPKDLTQYGGIKGQAKLKADMFSSALGKPSDNYRNYQKALTNATLLSRQVRQFYGDSIQPGVQKKLAQLTNPATWQNDPKVAMDNYNTFINTLKNETGTYRGALGSTDEYRGNNQAGSSSGKTSSVATLKYNPKTGKLEPK